MINVTKTYLPNIDKYKSYIDEIYTNGQLTNNGPLVQKLERKLEEYLGVNNVILVANGTLALDIAYRVLNLTGDVITTPFSFVATTSSIVSNGLNPLFSDINPRTFNINPDLIEEKITSKTSAIVPVHVFGSACEVEDMQKIAKRHSLKVIYDAAHAFDVQYKEGSILNYGDISTLSFHATKLFHTIEGGALIIKDDELANKARRLINFGINNTGEIRDLGINAKMNEFEAAMGLCVLDDINLILEKRKINYNNYAQALSGLVQLQEKNNNSSSNYAYFSIVLGSERQLLSIVQKLNKMQIFPRRYFQPSLNKLNYVEQGQICPVSEDISSRVLCLPLSHSIEEKDQNIIINTVLETL
ncbi:DegT/DnrJ/EryC1/StrS family aminotransferase [Candidatus Thioglobus sp.]|uniref:DegT/DnrJ/EryC1/StrS family aminotransferase n=1 Tax=Candidatus Thioglobus sp. TaxID=2026721 RepID=UPI003D1048D5